MSIFNTSHTLKHYFVFRRVTVEFFCFCFILKQTGDVFVSCRTIQLCLLQWRRAKTQRQTASGKNSYRKHVRSLCEHFAYTKKKKIFVINNFLEKGSAITTFDLCELLYFYLCSDHASVWPSSYSEADGGHHRESSVDHHGALHSWGGTILIQ